MATVQEPNITQPICPFFLGQIWGLFKEKPKIIQYIGQANLDKVLRQLPIPIWRNSILNCSSRALLVYITRVWYWYAPRKS